MQTLDAKSTAKERDVIQFRIAAARRMLARNGCESGAGGHVSMRDPNEPNTYWCTGLQYFDETMPDDVMKLGFDGSVKEGSGKVSRAVAFHAAIYKTRPDVNSVIHHHGYATAILSAKPELLRTYNLEAVPFHGSTTRLPACHDSKDGDENDRMLAECLTGKAVIMPNHGVVIGSYSVQDATMLAIMFEVGAKMHLECQQNGGKEMPPQDIAYLKESLEKYFKQTEWSSNLRRLRRTDPDLFVGAAPEVVEEVSKY